MSSSSSSSKMVEEKIQQLQRLVEERVPYCTGSLALQKKSHRLYFSTANLETSTVDFARPEEAELKVLMDACDPATFGAGGEDVYDESYRVAGKLDPEKFAVMLSPGGLGILSTVEEYFLPGEDGKRQKIQAELHKLNVYGPGGFFKAHKDTPRAPNMFGSLVLVLPTTHQGGALRLRQDNNEWIVESSLAFDKTKPSIVYVAFYGDVEHEVLPVRDGFRVTLTYNLYHVPRDSGQPYPPPLIEDPSHRERLQAAIRTAVLENTKNPLPRRAFFAFGLQAQYDLKVGTKLDEVDIESFLKGHDALLGSVLLSLGLKFRLRLVFDNEDEWVASDPDCEGPVLLDHLPEYIGKVPDYVFKRYDLEPYDKYLTCKRVYPDDIDPADVGKGIKPAILLRWVIPLSEIASFSLLRCFMDDEMYYEEAEGKYCLVVENNVK